MKRGAMVVLAGCLILIPVVIHFSRDHRPAIPETKGESGSSHATGATVSKDAQARDHPPVTAKVRPEIADQLPPGSELVETEKGKYIITLPGVGVYLANGVSVADRGLVFKGPIAFAASKEGPWVGYAGEGISMHLAKDGTTKLSGKSAIVRETTPADDPSGALQPADEGEQ